MGYGDINVGANKKAQTDIETTVDDTEMFNAYHQGAREQKPQEEEKEIKKENVIADSLINEDMEEINSSEHAVFEAVDRSNLPMTAKVTSVLSQELKNVSLDEIHFMLPVPDLSDITGVKIKVYLFGTKEWVEINVSSKNKNIDVIRHLITIIKSEEKDPRAFELRLIDDDEDYYIPFYDISAQDHNDAVGQFDTLALWKNKSYQPPKPATAEDMAQLKSVKSTNHSFFVIFIKLSFLETRIEMEMNTKIWTLVDLLRKINKRFDIDLRENMHWFKIHDVDEKGAGAASKPNKDDIDMIIYNQNIIDYRSALKNLTSKELDLVPKVYGDSIVGKGDYSREEIMSCSMKMGTMPNLEPSDDMRSTSLRQDSSLGESSLTESPERQRSATLVVGDKARDTKDFLYNEMSAKKLQEFEIIKINQKGKRQNRILGVDGYSVYNDKIPNRQK
jgi:hypothetical protein